MERVSWQKRSGTPSSTGGSDPVGAYAIADKAGGAFGAAFGIVAESDFTAVRAVNTSIRPYSISSTLQTQLTICRFRVVADRSNSTT